MCLQQFERDLRRYATHEKKMMLDNHALYDKRKVFPIPSNAANAITLLLSAILTYTCLSSCQTITSSPSSTHNISSLAANKPIIAMCIGEELTVVCTAWNAY